jgi:ABC-type bacteriocin/lantibiotic exporter with double-glycine peptidase domain
MAQNLEVEAKARGFEVELLTGIETLKTMGGERRALERWSELFVDVLNVSIARGRLGALADAMTEMLRLGSPFVILGYGALQVLDGRLTLGTMLGLGALAAAFLGPLSRLVSSAMQLQLLGTYLERINDVLDTAPEQERRKFQPAPPLRGHIALDGVSFRYKPVAPMAVTDVSIRIEPGQMVAIVGRSGAGKSTLASLLCGLYLPTAGRIAFDEIDLKDMDLRSVRQQLGVVTQGSYLFGTSIRANIALADPQLPMEAVIEAAKLAQIHDEIAAMPMGYDTLLIDRGASLSGGQRQRLALARALVHRPAILLLDEATSALDTLTERQVQQALASLRSTRIVIAHRLSTIMDADLILVMDGGRLVEVGTHEQLSAAGGIYTSLVSQRSGTQPRVEPIRTAVGRIEVSARGRVQ